MIRPLQYEIHGGQSQFLQIILRPNECVLAEHTAVSWFSECLTHQNQDNSIPWLMSLEDIRLPILCNQTQQIGYAGLAQRAGKIFVIKFCDDSMKSSSVNCVPDFFLCASSEVRVLHSPIKTLLRSSRLQGNSVVVRHCSGPGGSFLFLQSSGEIVTKELEVNESLTLKFSCLAAYSDTVIVSTATLSHGSASLAQAGDGFVTLKVRDSP